MLLYNLRLYRETAITTRLRRHRLQLNDDFYDARHIKTQLTYSASYNGVVLCMARTAAKIIKTIYYCALNTLQTPYIVCCSDETTAAADTISKDICAGRSVVNCLQSLRFIFF